MEISKLTFTPETKAAINKPLSHREKAVLLYKRIKELEDSGELKQIKSRRELGLAMGYTEQQCEPAQAGYRWVLKQINDGNVIEEVHTNLLGRSVSNFTFVGKAPYSNRRRRSRRRTRTTQTVQTTELAPVVQAKLAAPESNKPVKVTMESDGVRFTVEVESTKQAVTLLKQLLGGKNESSN